MTSDSEFREVAIALPSGEAVVINIGLAQSVPVVGPPRPKQYGTLYFGMESGAVLAVTYQTRSQAGAEQLAPGEFIEVTVPLPGHGGSRVVVVHVGLAATVPIVQPPRPKNCGDLYLGGLERDLLLSVAYEEQQLMESSVVVSQPKPKNP